MKEEKKQDFEVFRWSQNFITGLNEIDQQHIKLVNILNRLASHLANRSNELVLNQTLKELSDYADYHFECEEKIWRENFNEDEWFQDHQSSHAAFKYTVAEILRHQDQSNKEDHAKKLVFFLSKWLCQHILEDDKKMALAIKYIKLGMPIKEAKSMADAELSESIDILLEATLNMYGSLSKRTMELLREKSLRKMAEEQLQVNEDKWQFLLHDASDSIWDVNLETDSSSSIKEPEDTRSLLASVYDKEYKNLEGELQIHPKDQQELQESFEKHIRGESEFIDCNYRLFRGNATWLWMNTRARVIIRDDSGAALRIVGANSNITEKQLGSVIFKLGHECICVTDFDDNIVSINPMFLKVFGFDERQLIGAQFSLLFTEESLPKLKKLVESLQEWDSASNELEIRDQKQKVKTVRVNVQPIKSYKNFPDHYLYTLKDLSKKKVKELKMRHSNKMDAIGMMTSGVSHDFNNILAIIMGNIELLQSHISKQDPKVREVIKDLRFATKRGMKLSSQLLKFSSHSSFQIETKNISNILDSMKSLIRKSITPEIDIKIRLEESLWDTKFDSYEFEEVVINLLINARDAIQGTGKIELFAENVVLDEEFCNPYAHLKPGKYVKFSISDTGHGIDQSVIERIFEPFYTTKAEGEGTGLGLSMAFNFCDKFGGVIEAENSKEGAVFTMYFPKSIDSITEEVESNDEEVVEDKAEAPKSSVQGMVLIVDDEQSLVNLTNEILKMKGYETLTANSADQALDIISSQHVDLLFSDILMPGNMNGFDLANKARELNPEIKVLLSSGYEGEAIVDDSYPLLRKPYESQKLISAIENIMQNQF